MTIVRKKVGGDFMSGDIDPRALRNGLKRSHQ